jgi:pterin-4a-carbinolamine dehydratase
MSTITISRTRLVIVDALAAVIGNEISPLSVRQTDDSAPAPTASCGPPDRPTAGEHDANRTLRREFAFPNFRDAFGFVARVALLAESEGHHPDIELGWGRAAFSLTTNAADGLTRNDFIMAARIDRLAHG